MQDRRPGEGRYAHPEREQRWVVRELPKNATRAALVGDRYIIGTRLRLRRVDSDEGTTFKLGQKVRADPSNPELVKLTNVYLSLEEYSVLEALPAAELRKTRWQVVADGRAMAIDQFHGRLEGLVLAEVELDPAEDHRPPPSFAVDDVTSDDRFSGGALAFATDDAIDVLLTELRIAAGPQ